jgi:hypothetical protein
MKVLSPNDTQTLYKIVSDESNDSPIELPMIVVRRNNGFNILSKGKQPLSFDGATLYATHEKARQLNAIPISIPYQIDVYTRYQNECDEYIRNLVFNIINFPKLDVTVPYRNENRVHHSNIRLQEHVADNSDIPERLVPGQFVRMTLDIFVDDAYLFDVRDREVYSLEISSNVIENSEMNS